MLKLPVADDRLPTASRLSTWKKYRVLRASPLIVTECLVTSVRSTAGRRRAIRPTLLSALLDCQMVSSSPGVEGFLLNR